MLSISCSVFGRPSGFFSRSFSIISLAHSETDGDRGAGGSFVIEFNVTFSF